IRLATERRIDQQRQEGAERDQPEVDPGALEHVPDAEDRPAREPEEHQRVAASSAAFTNASASVFCSRGTCCRSTSSYCSSSSRARSYNGRKCACFTRNCPATWRMTSNESARTRTRLAPNGAAASSPAMSARYSATLLVVTPIVSLTVASRAGGSVLGSSTT